MLERLLREGTLVTVGVLVLCVLGIAAAVRVPVQMIPDLEVRTISVDTRWPGATPQDVEQEILLEQERFLRTLPNLSRMVSTASTGRATVELEFPFGVDINEALIRTNNALSQVPAYPENVDEPALTTSSFSDNAFMYFRLSAIAGSGLELDLDLLRDFVEDEVRPRLERADGVALVEVGGGSERQVRVEVDAAALAARGLAMDTVRGAIRARNRDVSAGDVDGGKRRYLVRTTGRFREAAELETLILDRREGAVVRLGDVARVTLDHAEPRELAFYNGRPTIGMSIRREPGSNVIRTKAAVLPEVEAANRELLNPLGLELTLSSDDVRYVESSVANVWTNLALGALLATGVLFAFLRNARSTLVAVVAIPVCTIAAFVGLLLAGRTLNVISLAGIAFAIGMTVDNTIVVVEAIDQARRRGLGMFEAALAGVRRVWPAVLASTLTTVVVFAPILFIENEAGQLYSDVAIAISASILASMAVAVWVVPALAARLDVAARGAVPGGALFDAMSSRLSALTATSRRRFGVLAASAIGTLGVVAVLMPPAEYLPEGEEPKTFSRMIAPPGYNLAEMRGIAEGVIRDLAPALDAEPGERVGGLPALAYYNLNVSAGGLRIIAEPKDSDDIDAVMSALDTRFLEEPGMRAFSSRGSIISSNDGGTRSVNLELAGTDLAELYATAERAYARAQALFDGGRIGSDPSSLSLDQPLLELRPRWERLAEVGLDGQRFGYAVAALSDGAFADEMVIGDDKVDIYLYSSAGSAQTLEALTALPVATPVGGVLPVSALADLVERADTDGIRRVDGRRTVTLNIIPPAGIALEDGVTIVERDLVTAMREDGDVPPGVTLRLSGASDQLSQTREAVAGNLLIALLLIYLLLVAIFRHWGRPLFVLATVPIGLAGGILGLVLLNLVGLPFDLRQPFDMITALGFVILLGTVVNNPILVVEESYLGIADGKSPADAVSAAVHSRLRPILMTTLTTIFGLAPLVLIPGEGTELYRGLGVVVLAGLLSSTVVTLTALPCLLRFVLERRLPGAPSSTA
jgi:multidrug efflux pump subunit AcrB